jgi:hypothetical protein
MKWNSSSNVDQKGLALQAAEEAQFPGENGPQRLKPISLRGVCVRPQGRTLQKLHFSAACLAAEAGLSNTSMSNYFATTVPQGLKPSSVAAQCGTAEAVPFVQGVFPQHAKTSSGGVTGGTAKQILALVFGTLESRWEESGYARVGIEIVVSHPPQKTRRMGHPQSWCAGPVSFPFGSAATGRLR